jgi:magnesium-transporting ATPase (P-type)
LPMRLSALHEAAGIDVLCVDKTGTPTRNELAEPRRCGIGGAAAHGRR